MDLWRIATKSRITISKNEIAVLLVCIVFVLMNLGAIGSNGRRRAKEAVCLSNLLQWGRIWKSYTDDHDGYFPRRSGNLQEGASMIYWPWTILHHRPDINRMLWFCPEATKPWLAGGQYPFAAWGPYIQQEESLYSSYCVNLWVSNPDDYDGDYSKFWRTPYVADAANVPLLSDGNWKDTEPEPTDAPWATREQMVYMGWEPNANEMKRVCIDRHGPAINAVFLDFSVRKVGLKEFWTLKWNQDFNTAGPWTKAGGVRPEDWPEWMRHFKDY